MRKKRCEKRHKNLIPFPLLLKEKGRFAHSPLGGAFDAFVFGEGWRLVAG